MCFLNKKKLVDLIAFKKLTKIMRAYVVNFFSCEYCRGHFEVATRDMVRKCKNNDAGVIYLWVGYGEGYDRVRFTW